MLPLFDLMDQAENEFYSKQYDAAFSSLVTLLVEFRAQYHTSKHVHSNLYGNVQASANAISSRVAHLWGELVSTPEFDLLKSPALSQALNHLMVLHEAVHGSPEGNLDKYIRIHNSRCNGKFNGQSLIKLIFLWVPGSNTDLDIFALYSNIPEVVVAQAISTIAAMTSATKKSSQARAKALEFLSSTEKLKYLSKFTPGGIILDTWMRCSYMDETNKHDVKNVLNEFFLGFVKSYHQENPQPPAREKPVILFPLEMFDSKHAMYRCYSPAIKACQEKFELVAMVTADMIDEEAERLFDRVVFVGGERGQQQQKVNISKACEQIEEIKPDMIFYTSLGMSLWTVMLATIRLAPVQVMSYGHPATANSKCIDYGVAEEQWVGDETHYMEKIISLPSGTFQFMNPYQATSSIDRRQRLQEEVHIAIPSISQKWSRRFLEMLKEVNEKTERPVFFHFFIGVPNFYYSNAVNAVRSYLPEAIVHPFMPYDKYQQQLRLCDLHAGTFPFGGTNSLIDSLLNGLPIICLKADQIHGMADQDFARRVGLPEWVVNDTVEDYRDTLLKLIAEPELLADLQDSLKDQQRISDIFFQQGRPEEFVSALEKLLPEPKS